MPEITLPARKCHRDFQETVPERRQFRNRHQKVSYGNSYHKVLNIKKIGTDNECV